MTTTRQIVIWCDGCMRWFQHGGSLIKQAEWHAKKEGWTVVKTKEGKKHYCGRCKHD